MIPICIKSDLATVAELSTSDGTATIEGTIGGPEWSADALQEASNDLRGTSVVAAGTACARGSLSVFDVGGKVEQASVEDGVVRFKADVKADLAQAAREHDADIFIRGRISQSREHGRKHVESAEIGRVLVGNSTDEALSVAARPSGSADGDRATVGAQAALADVEGELSDDERAVLQKREHLRQKW